MPGFHSLLTRSEVLATSIDVLGEEVRRMGSTICPTLAHQYQHPVDGLRPAESVSSRDSSADLEWMGLRVAKTAPIRAAGGPGRRLSSDSSGTSFGLTTSLEEVGPVPGIDA